MPYTFGPFTQLKAIHFEGVLLSVQASAFNEAGADWVPPPAPDAPSINWQAREQVTTVFAKNTPEVKQSDTKVTAVYLPTQAGVFYKIINNVSTPFPMTIGMSSLRAAVKASGASPSGNGFALLDDSNDPNGFGGPVEFTQPVDPSWIGNGWHSARPLVALTPATATTLASQMSAISYASGPDGQHKAVFATGVQDSFLFINGLTAEKIWLLPVGTTVVLNMGGLTNGTIGSAHLDLYFRGPGSQPLPKITNPAQLTWAPDAKLSSTSLTEGTYVFKVAAKDKLTGPSSFH